MANRSLQLELFAQPTWLSTVLRKLPGTDFLGVMDVALAFGVSDQKVREWIAEGRLEAPNLNAGSHRKNAFYRIPRSAVVAFAEKLSRGY